MLPFDVIALFFGAAVGLALVPGPDNVFVLTQSAMNGRFAGLMVTLGLATGLIVHTTAVALGVAVIFQTSQVAFAALKYFGAAYLVYLAWQAFRSNKANLSGENMPTASPWVLFRRGFIMNVANPKVTIFFLAFLPQFADPKFGPMTPQLFLLGFIMIIATLLVFGAVAFGAGLLGDWLRKSPMVQVWINRTAGVIFIALAAKLVLAQK